MSRIEQLESTLALAHDPIEAIVDLATRVRATSIATDARRISERLERHRFFVAVVGRVTSLGPIVERLAGDTAVPLEHPRAAAVRFGRWPHAKLTFRDGSRKVVSLAPGERVPQADVAAIEVILNSQMLRSGVCFVVGPPSMRPWHRRVDLVVTSKSDADEVTRWWPGVSHVVVDSSRAQDIDAALSLVFERAAKSGAAVVETHAAMHHRHLCIRLGHHLFEQQRALVCSRGFMLARTNALAIARSLTESVIEARTRQPDSVRDTLATWLELERRKFLMATKADALISLAERLTRTNRPRHRLGTTAASASHAIAVDLLAAFWRRTSAGAETPIAALSRSMLTELDVALGGLGESVSPQALAGFDLPPIRRPHRDTWPMPSGTVAHRFGLASRRSVEHAAQNDLVVMLAQGSTHIVDRVLFDYDHAKNAIEWRFCELIDSALQSVQVAAELGNQAQSDGADGVACARSRIAHWSTELAGIMVRFD